MESRKRGCLSREVIDPIVLNAGSTILPYTTKPTWHGYGPDLNASPAYGLEIEIAFENSNDQYESLRVPKNTFPYGTIWKSDSSIPTREFPFGAELVSAPMTLKFLRSSKSPFTETLNALSEKGAQTPYSCGMHVHVSAEGLTTTELYKLLILCRVMHHELFKFSGRSERTFNEYSRLYGDIDDFLVGQIGIRGIFSFSGLTRGGTIECRLFHSTLNPMLVIANVELVDTLLAFVVDTPVIGIIKKSTPLDFLAFAKSRGCKFLPYYWEPCLLSNYPHGLVSWSRQLCLYRRAAGDRLLAQGTQRIRRGNTREAARGFAAIGEIMSRPIYLGAGAPLVRTRRIEF